MTKYIIYKEGNKIKGTTVLNYYAMIQDANKILTFHTFTSLQQAKDYIIKYVNLTDEEVQIIIDKQDGVTSQLLVTLKASYQNKN